MQSWYTSSGLHGPWPDRRLNWKRRSQRRLVRSWFVDGLGDGWWCDVQQQAQLVNVQCSMHQSWPKNLHIHISSHRLLGHRFCSLFKCSTWTGHASCFWYIHVVLIFAEFEGRQRLFDQMSEIELNWLWRFSCVVGVTTPRAQHNQHMYRLWSRI